jgi:epoxyqueuosine reductase
MNNKLLLDSCCGPCSIPAIETLNKIKENTENKITLFVNNSNIDDKEEYEKRLEALKKVAKHYKKELIIDTHNPNEWFEFVKFEGFQDEPEGGKRCEKCYEFRIKKAIEYAKKNNFNTIATTLTTGPFKNAEKINKLGKQTAKEQNIEFLEQDFKQNGGYQKSIEKSKELKLYRQNFCGCKFSKRK